MEDVTNRYGIDVGAQTDLGMNAADNERAIDEALIAAVQGFGSTTVDASQALPGMDLTQFGGPRTGSVTGAAIGAPADPLSEDETRAAILRDYVLANPETRDIFALDGVQTTEVIGTDGVQRLAPSGYAALNAAQVPQTEDEVRAAILNDYVLENPDVAEAFALDGLDTTTIVGADGVPRIAPAGMAAINAAPAFVNEGSEAALQTESWVSSDGTTGGTAYFDTETRTWIDTQTGEAIPAGSRTGTIEDTLSSFGGTTSNQTQYNQVVAEANYGLGRIADFRTLLEQNPGIMGAPGAIQRVVNDVRQSLVEMQSSFGPDAPVTLEMLPQLTERYASSDSFDPAFAQAAAYALEMAYFDAKAADPSGEVNVRELERQLSVYQGGLLSSNASVLAGLGVLESRLIDRRDVFAPTLMGGQPGAGSPPPAGAPAGTAATPPPAAGGVVISPDDRRWLQGGQ